MTKRFQPMLASLHRALWQVRRARAPPTDGCCQHQPPDHPSQGLGRQRRDLDRIKKIGLAIEDMVKSRWLYRKLRNFRARIEANIS